MKMRTKQEVFEIAVKGLFAQGQRCADKYDQCCLRDEEGHKCALGMLIPDELYNYDMEVSLIKGLGRFNDFPEVAPYFGSKVNVSARSNHFYTDLQDMHDVEHHWDSEESFRKACITVAKRYKLNSEFIADLHFPKKES